MRTPLPHPWPHPFDVVLQSKVDALRAQRRLPLGVAAGRSAMQDKVLTHLLHAAAQANLEVKQLDTLNAIAAALIVCPADVALLYVDTSMHAPDFLLSPEQLKQRNAREPALTEAHIQTYEEMPKRVGVCGTCLTEFARHPLTVRLCYADLETELALLGC